MGVLLGVIEESDKVVQVLSLKNSRVQVGETVVSTNPRVEALETVFDEDVTSAEVASHELLVVGLIRWNPETVKVSIHRD